MTVTAAESWLDHLIRHPPLVDNPRHIICHLPITLATEYPSDRLFELFEAEQISYVVRLEMLNREIFFRAFDLRDRLSKRVLSPKKNNRKTRNHK
jgi:hypothetical protein